MNPVDRLSKRLNAPLLVGLAVCLVSLLTGCTRTIGVAPQDNTALVERRGIESQALRAAAEQIDGGDPDDAYETLVEWFRANGTFASDERDVALFLTANALIADARRFRAFYYLDELLDLHVGSDLYLDAVSRQFEIADSYLDGKTDSILFLPRTYNNDALEMLFRIQQRAPGTELAERALLRTAEHYFDEKDYDFAEDAYTVFIDRFPRSPSVRAARLKQAWSNLLQYEGPRYDPTPLLDAREQFAQFTAAYPDTASAQSLSEISTYIDEQLASKQLIKARFYERTGRGASAASLRTGVVERYPSTPQAAQARERLQTSPLPAQVPQTGERLSAEDAADATSSSGDDDLLDSPGARP